ncbi:MAG: hypothetical protein ABI618_14810 [Nitrospirota bacterium]
MSTNQPLAEKCSGIRGSRGYRPQQAQRFTLFRRPIKVRRRISPATWYRVNRLLQEERTPEQISGWLRTDQARAVSPEWIYQHVYHDKRAQGILFRHLRCQRQHRKRHGTYSCRGRLPNRVSIEYRPVDVVHRTRLVIGNWIRSLASATIRRWSL